MILTLGLKLTITVDNAIQLYHWY